VDLGGDPDTGVGGKTYRLREGSVVMIPAGTFHRLRNDTDEPFRAPDRLAADGAARS
jgi:quercetin dioxygenase-like cupin family protein